jgi:hypothetical protein
VDYEASKLKGDGPFLPLSDTCFFNFKIPGYSSKEVMRKMIYLAIYTDNVSLNADQQNMNMEDDNREWESLGGEEE